MGEEGYVSYLPFGRRSGHVAELDKVFTQTVDKLKTKTV